MKRLKTKVLNSVAAAALATAAVPALADMVTLTEVGGTVSIHGDLISYDGETYTVRTSLGDLRLQANRSICEGASCPKIEEQLTSLYVAGSGTVTGMLIPTLAQAYYGSFNVEIQRDDAIAGRTYFEVDRADQSDLMVTMMHSNSASGLSQLINGDLHAAFTTRPATAIEQAVATDKGLAQLRSEDRESVIAYDSLLVVTHPTNAIQAMSEIDIAAIFAGNISDWSTFGRSPGQINVYMREEDSNSRDLLDHALMKPNRKSLGANVIVLNSDAEIAEAVKGDPNAIGLTSFAYRQGMRALEIEGVCGIRVPATEFSIKTGEYPLARPVYLYHGLGDTASPDMEDFVAFIGSQEAQAYISAAGFINREIVSQPLNTQGLRVTHAVIGDAVAENMTGTRNMLKLMSYADRLSTTIRFDGGSTDLDAEDYEQLEQLAQMIKSSAYEGAKFYFMGFSDSVGRADLNQFVALKRAEIVRQALISRYPELTDRIDARSVGYGELSPLACNETRPGRVKNRRVEIWAERPLAVAER